MNTYIAVDIGASSGRLVKSSLIDGKIQMEEIYRFKNGFSFKNNQKNNRKYFDCFFYVIINLNKIWNIYLIKINKFNERGDYKCLYI